jgi:DNA-binding transcriptional LysR family regulator
MGMSLPSNYLDAFVAVAKTKSFSRAAQNLHITQSALSQRVLNLEQELGSTLFIRDPAGIRPTELGHRLLRYCLSKEILENEFLSDMRPLQNAHGKNGESHFPAQLRGIIRLSAFSTVGRSFALPLLAELMAKNPLLQLELKTAELRELPSLLFSGETDFLLTNYPIEKKGIENFVVGLEEYVLVRSLDAKCNSKNVFIDHDSEDSTTHEFLKGQTSKKKLEKYQRIYLDEIYTILDGVKLGLGVAVVPKHLLKKMRGIEIDKSFRPLLAPVYLNYYHQLYYTELQQAVIQNFQNKYAMAQNISE